MGRVLLRNGEGGEEGGEGSRSNGGKGEMQGRQKARRAASYGRGRQGCLELMKLEHTQHCAVASGVGMVGASSYPVLVTLECQYTDTLNQKPTHTWTPDDDAARAKAKTEARRSILFVVVVAGREMSLLSGGSRQGRRRERFVVR